MNFQLLITFLVLGLVKSSLSLVYKDVSDASEDNPVQLDCTGEAPFSWFYEGASLESNQSTYLVTSSKNTGTYTCSVGGEQQDFITLNPPEPTIAHVAKSIIFYDGDQNQSMTCTVIASDPLTPSLSWESSQMDLVGQTKILNSEGNTTTSELVLSKVDASTRGTFICSVTYSIDGSDFQSTKSASVMVRVHSSMEALWPALGIVAEILFIVIVIYVDHSRRKNAKEE